MNGHEGGRRSFVNTKKAAELIGLSPATLCSLRVRGGGPPYRKVRSRVMYDVHELLAWVDAHTRLTTAERGTTEP